MAAGATLYSDISARIDSIREDTFAVARTSELLPPTVLRMSAQGLMTRVVDTYTAATFAIRGEDDEIAPQKFNKDAKSTLTPYQYGGAFRITDARASSDFDAVIADAKLELGAAAAAHVDSAIAGLFDDGVITGGTVGSGAGSTISWSGIASAQALLSNANIPRGSPVYVVLHPYQWSVLYKAATIAGATIAAVQPSWQEGLGRGNTFFQTPAYAGMTFIVTNAIPISGTAAYGAMYVPQAFVLDTRKTLDIEPIRRPEREANDLYATFWYAVGAWRPEWAIALRYDAATPS